MQLENHNFGGTTSRGGVQRLGYPDWDNVRAERRRAEHKTKYVRPNLKCATFLVALAITEFYRAGPFLFGKAARAFYITKHSPYFCKERIKIKIK